MERVESTPQTELSYEEAAALAYFAMGVSSEGGFGGKNVAYRLSIAGKIDQITKQLKPVGNSGYSIGTIQTDLGQHPATAAALVEAFVSWTHENAETHPERLLTEAGIARFHTDLARTGNQIELDRAVDIAQPAKGHLNTFLSSPDGIGFVHGRDVAQIDRLLRIEPPHRRPAALQGLAGTALFAEASDEDRIRLAAIFLKVENQSGRGLYPGVLDRIANEELHTVADVQGAFSRPSYVASGVAHALAGTELYLKLRSAHPDNPLAASWRSVMANPLVDPTQLRGTADAEPGFHYETIKALFLSPALAGRLVDALDRGGTHLQGDPARANAVGFFARGNDFLLWDGDGKGLARVDGEWRDIHRSDVTRIIRDDRTVDLVISVDGRQETLLRLDRNAPELRPATATPPPVSGHTHPVMDQLRELYSRHGIASPENRVERDAASIVRDALRSGGGDVSQLGFGKAATDGGVDAGDRVIAWQGDPRDPATAWSATPLRRTDDAPLADTWHGIEQARHSRQATGHEQPPMPHAPQHS